MLAMRGAADVVDEADDARRELAGARAERRQEIEDQRLEVAVDTQGLEHRESEGEQRYDREHRGVHQAHRAEAELAGEQVAQ